MPEKALLVKDQCHLPIHPCQLSVVTVLGGGIGTVEGVMVALQSHGGLAVLVVGAAQQVVGQQLVVGRAVVVEETDVGFYVLGGKGLVVAVAYIDAVEAGPHQSPLASRGASHQHQQQPEKEACQSFHGLQRYVKILETTKLLRKNFRYWSKKDWKMTE